MPEANAALSAFCAARFSLSFSNFAFFFWRVFAAATSGSKGPLLEPLAAIELVAVSETAEAMVAGEVEVGDMAEEMVEVDSPTLPISEIADVMSRGASRGGLGGISTEASNAIGLDVGIRRSSTFLIIRIGESET